MTDDAKRDEAKVAEKTKNLVERSEKKKKSKKREKEADNQGAFSKFVGNVISFGRNEEGEKKKSVAKKKQSETKKAQNTDKKKTERKRFVDPTLMVTPSTVSVNPKATSSVESWVERSLSTGVTALREEYRSLSKYTMNGMTFEKFTANAARNRYQDVPCQDQNRVALVAPPANVDYIHANYVGTPHNDKRFICTQGPLDNTIEEFWWMVWQEQAEQVIMLCNCIETGKYKCAQYWPENVGEQKTVGTTPINIENLESKNCEREPSVRITSLRLTIKDEKRLVRHIQWLDWPDRGVPPCRLTAMEILSTVRGSPKPIVVHCSAGIGRTGTIVAIEYIMEKLCAGYECMAMGELLKEMRNQRAFSIQNDLQYLYIHRVMLCYFLEKYKEKYSSILTEENQQKYRKFVDEYNQAIGFDPNAPGAPPPLTFSQTPITQAAAPATVAQVPSTKIINTMTQTPLQ